MYSGFSDGLHSLAQIAGISALVPTRRRDTLDSALEDFLLQQLRTSQLVYALCTRKPLPGDIVVPTIPSRSAYLDSLLELAFRLPPFLEAIDSMFTTEHLHPDHDMLNSFFSLESALLAWLKAFHTSLRYLDGNYINIGNTNWGTLTPVADKSFFTLTCEALCQICLLLVSECHAAVRSLKPSQSPEPYASDLCKTIKALIDAASSPGCKARAVRGPLHFLNMHYTGRGDQRGLQWCTQVKDSVCKEAPYLHWDGLLPQTFMGLSCMPG